MHPTCEQLAHYWKSQALTFGPGASEDSVLAFEVTHHIAFPPDFRDYLIHFGGMTGADAEAGDKNLFYFWPLQNFSTLSAHYKGYRVRPNLAADSGAEHCIVFADFLIESHLYAIDCTPSGGNAGLVYLEAPPTHLLIARSFSEFLALYIRDDLRIYGAKP